CAIRRRTRLGTASHLRLCSRSTQASSTRPRDINNLFAQMKIGATILQRGGYQTNGLPDFTPLTGRFCILTKLRRNYPTDRFLMRSTMSYSYQMIRLVDLCIGQALIFIILCTTSILAGPWKILSWRIGRPDLLNWRSCRYTQDLRLISR